MAGAANELTDALIVNPQDVNDLVAALKQALEMNVKEQRWRLEKMQEKLKKYNVKHWANTFMKEQVKLMENQKLHLTDFLSSEKKDTLLSAYRKAKSRLIILDYDGTLMEFQRDPMAVVPDEALLGILSKIKEDPNNKIVINSGRDQPTLNDWLGHFGFDMAAEHGVWMRRNNKWQVSPGLHNNWKPRVRTVLENLVERTPGSFIEEKQFSIAWHYRSIDKDLGEKRVREFRDVLRYLTANLDLQVLEGNKVVEIKNAGVNKGKATLEWVNEQDWDFIMAIGDDHTDEDTFLAIPENQFTIKVGLENTAARFNLRSVKQVRELLKTICESE